MGDWNEELTRLSEFDSSGTLVMIDPPESILIKEKVKRTAQFAWLLGLETKLNNEMSIGIQYYHGFYQSKFPFAINKFELFFSKRIEPLFQSKR